MGALRATRQNIRPLSIIAQVMCLWLCAGVASAKAQTGAVPERITEPVDLTKRIALRGHTHPLARPENDRGAAPDDLPMGRILLVLHRSGAQETELRKLLDEQQIKSSPNYHHWLTPSELGQRFGPTDSDIQAVTDWLTSQGFQVNQVAAARTVIEFSGTAGLVREALHTEIHQYETNGERHWANASDPEIPAALAPVVAGIASLNNFPRKPMHHVVGVFRRSKATGEVTPLFTFPLSGRTFYGLGPADFATIYNVQPLLNAGTDGTGQSIAIVADSNINIKDVRDFRSMFGLAPNDPQVILNGPDPGLVGTEIEADLDVEWAGAVARKATIKLIVSQDTISTFGTDLSALYIVDNNLAPILSESFGGCEEFLGNGGNAFENAIFEQAAAEGITVIVSAGDSGSATCDRGNFANAAQFGLSVSGVASTPFNVAVGGTDFNDVGNQGTYWNATNNAVTGESAKSYIPETTWNNSCAASGSLTACANPSSSGENLVAGGGGPSNCVVSSGSFPNITCLSGYTKPAWQTGSGVPSDGARDIPDVSLFANGGVNFGGVSQSSLSFYIMCDQDLNASQGGSSSSCDLSAPYLDFILVGGTSAATPSFAGIMALVNQKTGERQGNANYVLYKLAAQSGSSCASNTSAVTKTSCTFYDTVAGNNSVACQGGTSNCSNTTSGGFGILTTTTGGTTPAWNATAGYDPATGLGSVNAANLVKNWSSVSFAPTTTSLTLSPSPVNVTHGQSVNVSIKVNSGSGTPAGDVSLLGPSGTAFGVGPFALSGGSFAGATNMLPGGNYNVTAHYAGDGTFGASDSTAVPVAVSPETSTLKDILVISDFNTGAISSSTTTTYGSIYIARVDVENSSGSLCAPNGIPVYGCPTGTLTWTANGQPLPNQPPSAPSQTTFGVNSAGYVEDDQIQFPAGSYNVVAAYSGDNSYKASTSTVTMTITKATTTASVSANPVAVAPGSSVTLTADIATQSNGVAPTGTVQFFNGSSPIGGTVTYSPTNGSAFSCFGGFTIGCALLEATLQTSFSTTGNFSITAQYSGDTNYTNSTSGPITVNVTSAINFTLAANPASLSLTPGQPGSSTVTVAPVNGFTGTVTFTCSVSPVVTQGPACSLLPTSVTNSGSTTLTVTTTAPSDLGPPPGPNWFVSGGAAVFLSLLVLLVIPTERRRTKVAFALLYAALFAAVLSGCGGGGGSHGNPGTPAGTYTIAVTGTSGTLTHVINVSVTVQ